MIEWWNALDTTTQVFFCFAIFFGGLFLWQFVATLLGMGGHGDVDAGQDIPGGHDVGHDVHQDAHNTSDDSTASFHLLSFRSILAFFTLFSWYVALMLMNKGGLFWAMVFGLLWGLAGMLIVALAFYLMAKATEIGTSRLETCLNTIATVYADIPANGTGQIRCTVSGCVTIIKARGAGGQAIKAGAAVQVLWKIDETTVEVQPTAETAIQGTTA